MKYKNNFEIITIVSYYYYFPNKPHLFNPNDPTMHIECHAAFQSLGVSTRVSLSCVPVSIFTVQTRSIVFLPSHRQK